MNNKITAFDVDNFKPNKNLEPITTDKPSNYADFWLTQNYIENFFKEIEKIQDEIESIDSIILEYAKNISDISNNALENIPETGRTSVATLVIEPKPTPSIVVEPKPTPSRVIETETKTTEKVPSPVKGDSQKTKVPKKIPTITGKIIGTKVSVKTGKSTKKKTIYTLKKGEKVTILKTSGKWTKIKLSNGKKGWIYSKNIKAGNKK